MLTLTKEKLLRSEFSIVVFKLPTSEFTWQIFSIQIKLVSSELLTCPLPVYLESLVTGIC